MIQGNNTGQELYNKIHGHLSLILNKIACLDKSEDNIYLLTKNYINKTLETFCKLR